MIKVDVENGTLTVEDNGQTHEYKFGTAEAFKIISDIWLRVGWDNKYVYSFTWLGRPIIQLPEDLIRIQEVIYALRPDVIIETGVAHGGSLLFYASLCKVLDVGRVIGVDIEIRSQNRQAIDSHPLRSLVTLIEGDSIDCHTINKVKAEVGPSDKVLVLLDSCHHKQHVFEELKAYAALVTPGSYIISMDGIMEQLVGAPRTQPDWSWNNPRQAAIDFVGQNENFIIEEPAFVFNEGGVTERITYWPSAFIKRLK